MEFILEKSQIMKFWFANIFGLHTYYVLHQKHAKINFFLGLIKWLNDWTFVYIYTLLNTDTLSAARKKKVSASTAHKIT